MADKITTARPYAKAAFEEAAEKHALEPWSQALHIAAAVVRDPRVESLLDNPRVTPEELAELVSSIAGPQLGQDSRNFVLVLAENRRLAYLPEVSALFDEFKDDAEGFADVTVTSATPLDAGQQRNFSEALARRLKRKVRLHCEVDPQLIGGAIVRAGDLVIDGSMRARLERMAYALTA
jgi:F-type H+-transporting ATPase subunit delta